MSESVSTRKIPSQNRLLASLPEAEYHELLPHLEPLELPHGKVLYEIGDEIDQHYFPSQAMVSLVTQMKDGKIVEVGLVGNDGVTGISALMGRTNSFERALVQIPDGGFRVKRAWLQERFEKGGALQRLLLGYMNDLMRQVSQTAACNASHIVEERLARWLLMCSDRINSLELNLTQEFISEMLGTRRGTVNVAAITLQSAGLIRYVRGHITILDRPGLEGFACECYDMLRKATTQPAPN